mmetsp:Transcript_67408/g.82614  ORF Transcript_67408/g.82614 Transcript_67408/m.82614 type:complete len:239 (-) Transcript_67408:144-860(-)
MSEAWEAVFKDFIDASNEVNILVNKCNESGLQFLDMNHATTDDIRGLCDELEITDEDKQKKFADSVAKNLITFSQFNFILKNIQYSTDKLPRIIKELNEMEKPVVLITNQDIENICRKDDIKADNSVIEDIKNLMGWYKVFIPLIGTTKMTRQNVLDVIYDLYSKYGLPFFAMEEANDTDVEELLNELNLLEYDSDFNGKFQESVIAQLKLQGMHVALSEVNIKSDDDDIKDDIKEDV